MPPARLADSIAMDASQPLLVSQYAEALHSPGSVSKPPARETRPPSHAASGPPLATEFRSGMLTTPKAD